MSKLRFIPLLLLLLAGCRPESEYPDEPVIEFKSFEVTGDEGVLIIGFTDGDGDIGLKESDIYPPFDTSSFYFNNIFLNYEEKVNGAWVAGTDINGDPIVFAFRVPYVTPEGQNKALKGEIKVRISPIFYNPNSVNSDTVRFKVKLYDRTLHESNEIITDEIVH